MTMNIREALRKKFESIQSVYEEDEEEVIVASLGSEKIQIVDIFSRTDRKIALVERVLASAVPTSLLKFANPCQHAPYPAGRSCDYPVSGEHKASAGAGAGAQEIISKHGLTGDAAEYVSRKIEAAHGDPEKIAKVSAKVDIAQETMGSADFGENRKAQYYPDGKPIPGTDEWLGAHGISRSVFEGRPYVRIPRGGPIPSEVTALYAGEPKALKQLETVLTQEPAWVMVRTAVPGMEAAFGKEVPQTRPDNAVVTNKAEQAARATGVDRAQARLDKVNGLVAEGSGEGSIVGLQKERIEETKKRLEAAGSMTKEKYLEPSAKALGDAIDAVSAAKSSGATKEELADLKDVVARKKRNVEGAEKRAGFLFARGDAEYQAVETANVSKQLKYAENKLEKYKADPVAALEHEKELARDGLGKAQTALDEVAIKYIFPPNLTAGEKVRAKASVSPSDLEIGGSLAGVDLGKAGRVEIHGAENIAAFTSGKGRVYLAMEGNIKSDAVQTAIKAEGESGASVISVPSVTLWRHPEMLAVARKYLAGREVVLIPDADGVKNPNVRNESRALQSMLESVGARVVVAAPPLNYTSEKTGRQKKIGEVQEVTLPSGAKEELKGVDDYLGAGKVIGATLGGLDVLERKVPRGQIKKDVQFDPGLTSRGDSAKTMVALSNLLGPKGAGRVSRKMLSAASGKFDEGKGAGRNLEYLAAAGHVRVEYLYDPDAISRGVRQLHGNMTPERVAELHKAGVISSSDLDMDRGVDHGYVETPIVSIVNPAHRAVDSAPHALGVRVIRTAEGAARYGGNVGDVIEPAIDEENPFAGLLALRPIGRGDRLDVMIFGYEGIGFDAPVIAAVGDEGDWYVEDGEIFDEYSGYLSDLNDHSNIYSSSYGDLERAQEEGIDY